MSDTQNGTPNAAQPAPKAHKLDKRNPWRKVIILVVILLIVLLLACYLLHAGLCAKERYLKQADQK